ncbi:hypothetical protein ACSSS7_007838 [Eimeria intestinalis]
MGLPVGQPVGSLHCFCLLLSWKLLNVSSLGGFRENDLGTVGSLLQREETIPWASLQPGRRPHKQHKHHAPFVLLLLDSTITWRAVCGLSRLAASVGKELLLAVATTAATTTTAATATAAAATAGTAEAGSSAAGGGDSLSFRLLRLRRFFPL